MHEYALTSRIVEIALETAQKQKAARVSAVSLVIGECSGVLIDSVQLYFDMIAEGTAAEGAQLLVHVIQPQMHCPVCDQNFTRPRFSFACPQCGALGSPTEIGKEFYIESVELEQ
ncbi:MAG: hydrogenase maturation nickel metallochaperone HypA [Clostridiaceae bacterium]|nr:hydrogenase maturation nickel metallochaperone HypA [Clostridiaceae bacterium]